MKRSIFIVIAVLFAAFSARAYAVSDAPDTSAASAIVMHSGGEVIYEKNADAQSLIASTTKLMTAIVAIENCGLDDELEVGAESCCIEGSSMYLHLGQNEIVPEQRVIGIFDLDKCSYEKRTRDYLAAAEKEGVVLDVSGQLPRSFVVCDHPYHRQIVYLSQLSPATLQKRAESRQLEL